MTVASWIQRFAFVIVNRRIIHNSSICLFGCLIALGNASAQSDNVLSANFRKVQTITLSDPQEILTEDLLISQIWSLDIDSKGRLLVVDLSGGQAFLFDSDGSLLAVLDPSSCHPGFEFRPVNAIFQDDQSIFLVNAGPWGYRFTAEGECLGNVHSDFSLAMVGFLDTDSRGNLVGLYRMPTASVIRHMTSKGETVREIELPASKFPNANARIRRGGIVADETYTFYAGALEPHVLKVTRDGTIESKILHRTSWFHDASKDIPGFDSGGPAALMKAIGDMQASTTFTNQIFELNDQSIMVQYSGPKGLGYQIFTKDGLLVTEELGTNYLFEQAKSGLLYRVVQPDMDYTDLGNPSIEVYEYISP
ncbi:MAG: hypothetical protein F4120_01685 [Rhodothermaceae bacterium]|nr:hypothetical protein [Rhodothermaceae bacterium]MXW31964.1 hypothetical protein [Rhodothermaceae bacterium]MYC05231.1 hypothetical protein [Rhodothermaceae bacterium]MYE62172.1 hypothetical protein [Rhodothermaceae bacterium]MYI16323.1 hypothetical protein [Rhodothermaceae bacterium]